MWSGTSPSIWGHLLPATVRLDQFTKRKSGQMLALSLPHDNPAPMVAASTNEGACRTAPTTSTVPAGPRSTMGPPGPTPIGSSSGGQPFAETAIKRAAEEESQVLSGILSTAIQGLDLEEADFDEDELMGACYAKCKPTDDEIAVLRKELERRRAQRKAKRSNLTSDNVRSYNMKAGESTVDTVKRRVILEEADEKKMKPAKEGMKLPTAMYDVEELGRQEADLQIGSSPAKNTIEVDYEEHDSPKAMTNATTTSSERVSISKSAVCAPEACGTLNDSMSTILPPNDDPTSTSSSRRRSRKNSGSFATTPALRGKSVMMITQEARSSANTELVDHEEEEPRCSPVPKLCLCEVKLHKDADSCWLVANQNVYDVTGMIKIHPGGPRSILRKAGGPDCTQDMKFHTKKARKLLEKCFIGRLEPCGDKPENANCTIM